MLVTIRVDASTEIGSGHMMRCLTLAEALRAQGDEVAFVCADQPGNLLPRVAASDFVADVLPSRPNRSMETGIGHDSLRTGWQEDVNDTVAMIAARYGRADWVVVDHYAIDVRWEREVRKAANRVLAIDDLADRPHDCDLLLDQNVATPLQTRYDALIGPSARKLLGPSYLLLRQEFLKQRASQRQQSERALVFFGGADSSGLTLKLLEVLAGSNIKTPLCVLVGAANPGRDAIVTLCAKLKHEVHVDAAKVAELISRCEFAICACGFFAYELMSLRTPALLTAQSDIQWTIAKALEGLGVAVALSPDELLQRHVLERGIARTRLISRQSQAFDLVTGDGARNVAREMKTFGDGS